MTRSVLVVITGVFEGANGSASTESALQFICDPYLKHLASGKASIVITAIGGAFRWSVRPAAPPNYASASPPLHTYQQVIELAKAYLNTPIS